MKHDNLSKHIHNLSSASRTILLSGHTEPYLQSLAKALSHYYKTRLLLVKVTDFSLLIQSKYGSSSKADAFVCLLSLSIVLIGHLRILFGQLG